MRTLVLTLMAVALGHAMASVPLSSDLELSANCTYSGQAVDLQFTLTNKATEPIWITGDTEPWAPSFISNRFSAEVNGLSLRGPLSFGHNGTGTRVPGNGQAAGTVALAHAFPELLSSSGVAPVLVRWSWQGLAAETEYAVVFAPTAKFEGEAIVQDGKCVLKHVRRV